MSVISTVSFGDAGYWLDEWPETVRGIALNAGKDRNQVAQELAALAGDKYGLSCDEIITEYAASIGR